MSFIIVKCTCLVGTSVLLFILASYSSSVNEVNATSTTGIPITRITITTTETITTCRYSNCPIVRETVDYMTENKFDLLVWEEFKALADRLIRKQRWQSPGVVALHNAFKAEVDESQEGCSTMFNETITAKGAALALHKAFPHD